MKKTVKKLLTCGVLFIFLGAIIALIGLGVSGFDFKSMSLSTYETHYVTVDKSGTVEKIVLDFHTGDISVNYSSAAEELSISYQTKHTKSGSALTTVAETQKNGIISLTEKRNWKANINLFNFYDIKITVTIPEELAVALDIETGTGDVSISGAKAPTRAEITTDTGDVRIESSAFTSLDIEVDTGNLRLKDVAVSDAFIAECDTGDISATNLSAKSIEISTDSGDVDLRTISSQTSISAETDTGDVELYEKITASTVYINTDTGDVDGENATVDAQSITIETSTGDAELKLMGSKSDYQIFISDGIGKSNVSNQQGGARLLKFTSSTGDGEFYFVS